jgi:hypothetical protein
MASVLSFNKMRIWREWTPVQKKTFCLSTQWEFEDNGHWKTRHRHCWEVRWEVSDTEHQQKKASRVCFQQGEILKKLALIWKLTRVPFFNTVRIWREWTRVHTNDKRVVFQQRWKLKRLENGRNGKRVLSKKWAFENTGNKWRASRLSTKWDIEK